MSSRDPGRIGDCEALRRALDEYADAPEEERAELRATIARRKIELGCPGVELPADWRVKRG